MVRMGMRVSVVSMGMRVSMVSEDEDECGE